MSITKILGNMLGLEEAQEITGYKPALGASWAQEAPAWVFFGCLGLTLLAVLFYVQFQRRRHPGARAVLAAFRAVVLCLLLLLLAEPVVIVNVSSQKRPALWLLIDGTDSMAIPDVYTDAERAKLDAAVGLTSTTDAAHPAPDAQRTRMDYVQALLRKTEGNLLGQLAKRFRLRAFLLDRPDGVRSLDVYSEGGKEVDVERLAGKLTTEGQVTALGAALGDLARRQDTSNLAGLVVVSDFDQNAGPPPLAAARALRVPIYAVGVGAATAVDVGVAVQADPYIKKDEKGTVTVTVRQQGLDNETVTVRLFAERSGGAQGAGGSDRVLVGEKPVPLTAATQDVEFPYVPDKAGRFNLVAEIDPVRNEVVTDNNRAEREITVLDEFLRLLFVEYEPTWEWRFIKEVFHRDKLVGMQGFRTYLRSADPRVKQTNEMFLQNITPASRAEFFANDVIFLGDVPAAMLNASPRFCQMTDEFVRNFGGGLVVIAGPRFGPGQLAETPLAKLLPVKVNPGTSLYDRQPFRLQLTPRAEGYGFMQLAGDKPGDNQKAWDNLGMLPWYHRVERLQPLATALAVHPTHTCVDDKTPQPLVAIQRVGRGEVVYVGFNETWRLRRKYGEQYYRAFWGQLIHRLALSHELGSQKRFVVKTDRRRYQANDDVLLTVEAYDAEFLPLTEEHLALQRPAQKDEKKGLRAELILPPRPGASGEDARRLVIPLLKKGVFETHFKVTAGGEYRIRVTDPITDKKEETTFRVKSVEVERQSAVRNVTLQAALAAVQPGGKSYDLGSVASLVDIELQATRENSIEIVRLWHTWLAFGLVVLLLLSEWLGRKWVNLP
jgi:hypothetical protein